MKFVHVSSREKFQVNEKKITKITKNHKNDKQHENKSNQTREKT